MIIRVEIVPKQSGKHPKKLSMWKRNLPINPLELQIAGVELLDRIPAETKTEPRRVASMK